MNRQVLILSLGRRGGSVRYGHALIDAMPEVSKQVFVSRYCTENLPEQFVDIPTYRNKIEFLIASILILPLFWGYVLSGLVKGKYKLLYTPYTHYWNILFLITFRLFGLKTISTVHDGIPHTGDGNWFERSVNYATLRRSSHLIFLSEHVQRYLKSKVGIDCESSVIPHGLIEIKGVNVIERELKNSVTLLFLGRVCHYKGIDLLLDALEILGSDNIKQLVIAGEVAKDQKHLMKRDIGIKVVWKDRWLYEHEVAAEIMQSDVLVLPYREATQSGVASIGISSGLPMVLTKIGGLVEQCRFGEGLFADPTPQSLAAALRKITEEAKVAQDMTLNMEKTRQKLTWRSIALQVMQHFD